MIKRLALVLATALYVCAAAAQPAPPFLGSWKVVWQGEKQEYEARLVITEAGGSWQTFTRSKNNQCVGREVPIRIDSATPTELNVTLQFSQVIPGCGESPVSLVVGTNGAVTGLRSGKYELVLTKQK